MKHLFTALLLLCVSTMPVNAKDNSDTRLYRLDCGNIHVLDLNIFSSNDAYIDQQKKFVVSCYLIKHRSNWILWDTGLPNAISQEIDNTRTDGPFKKTLSITIPEQLKALNLNPSDITHIAVSHGHNDHAGNVNMFPNATLLIQDAEFNALKNSPEKAKQAHIDPEDFSHFLKDENAGQVKRLHGDTDLFNDGIMKAVSLPGHTPGHMALLVNLPENGPVILSGDQWHFTKNHERNDVPSFNYDKDETLQSSDKLNALIKETGARLIIQHEPKDNIDFPVLMNYLK